MIALNSRTHVVLNSNRLVPIDEARLPSGILDGGVPPTSSLARPENSTLNWKADSVGGVVVGRCRVGVGGESNGDAIQVRFAMVPRGTAEPCPSGRPNSFRGGENHPVFKIASILRR